MKQQEQFAPHQIKRGPSGHRVGQCHHKAKLSDDQVRAMRKKYADGKASLLKRPIGYSTLAKEFDCAASTVRDIVQYRTRYAA